MSRTAWVPDFGNGPELYQQAEVPEPGDPGWPGTDLPDEGDPWAPAVNQLRAEIAADYAEAQAEVDALGLDAEPEADWDSADSNAYQDRVEAGLEPEAEAGG
jgi:hypothetical protein